MSVSDKEASCTLDDYAIGRRLKLHVCKALNFTEYFHDNVVANSFKKN